MRKTELFGSVQYLNRQRQFSIAQSQKILSRRSDSLNLFRFIPLIYMASAYKYILQLTIKEGLIDLFYVRPDLMVETAVDGIVDEANKTTIAKMNDGQVPWNKVISLEFSTLEPVTPVIISMSMLRKHLLQPGFMLLGTARFSTSELIPILNKGSVERSVKMNMVKGIPVSGSLLISLNLTCAKMDSACNPVETKQHPLSLHNADSKAFKAVDNCSKNTPVHFTWDVSAIFYPFLLVACLTLVCSVSYHLLG